MVKPVCEALMKIAEHQRTELGIAMEYEIEDQAATRRYKPVKRAFIEIGVGTTRGYQLINQGLIRAVKLGRKTYIDMQSVTRMFESLPELRPTSPMRVLSAADIGLPVEPDALHGAALPGEGA
jgi:hypothetical protein